MKTIRLEIKTHVERMAVLSALSDNGYKAYVKQDTAYTPTKVFVYVEVEDCEVKE